MNGPAPRLRHRLRRRVYALLDAAIEDRLDQLVHRGLIGLVLLNVAAVVLDSVPELAGLYGPWFVTIEVASIAVFVVEYGLRMWASVEHPPYADVPPWRARLTFMFQPTAIIDLLAILPFPLALMGYEDLRVLLLLRLARFFKLARYSPGLASLFEVIYLERRALLATLLILGGLVLTMASLMHVAERDSQPDKFGSIPLAMWWAVVTLTTVGYGDVVPATIPGKVLAGLTAILGVAMLALPVGIISTAFAEAIKRRDFVVTWTMVARVPLFRGLGAGAVADIMNLLRARTVAGGEVVVRRGEPAHAMYFVAVGEVEIERDGESERVREGGFFGEIAILRETERSATIRAVVDTRLLELDAADLRELMAREPSIDRRVRKAARTRAGEPEEGGDLQVDEVEHPEGEGESGAQRPEGADAEP